MANKRDFTIFLYDLNSLAEDHPRRHHFSPEVHWEAMFFMDGQAVFLRESSWERALRSLLNSIRWHALYLGRGPLKKEEVIPWWDEVQKTQVCVEGNLVIGTVDKTPSPSGRYEIQVSQFDCDALVIGLPLKDASADAEVKRLQKALIRAIETLAPRIFNNPSHIRYCERHHRLYADLLWEHQELNFGLPSNSEYGDVFRKVVLTPESLTFARTASNCPYCPEFVFNP